MSNLMPNKWQATFTGPFNATSKNPEIAELVLLGGISTARISPPNTPPGQVETVVWVSTDEAKDTIDSKPQFHNDSGWLEIDQEL